MRPATRLVAALALAVGVGGCATAAPSSSSSRPQPAPQASAESAPATTAQAPADLAADCISPFVGTRIWGTDRAWHVVTRVTPYQKMFQRPMLGYETKGPAGPSGAAIQGLECDGHLYLEPDLWTYAFRDLGYTLNVTSADTSITAVVGARTLLLTLNQNETQLGIRDPSQPAASITRRVDYPGLVRIYDPRQGEERVTHALPAAAMDLLVPDLSLATNDSDGLLVCLGSAPATSGGMPCVVHGG